VLIERVQGPIQNSAGFIFVLERSRMFFVNLCPVHLLKIVPNASVRNLFKIWCKMHLFLNLLRLSMLQICANCTCCKFVPSALDKNLCGMHLLQICARCIC
jgi:hypothetical protein